MKNNQSKPITKLDSITVKTKSTDRFEIRIGSKNLKLTMY